jgi:heme oxygenase (biliverdin-IX-beta and delta-forming)
MQTEHRRSSAFHLGTPRRPHLDLLTLLRERTRDRHARLDAAIDFRANDITTGRYAAFLRGVLAVVTPLEPAIASCLGAPTGRSRAERVRADLATLRASTEITYVPLRTPQNVAEAYGCAYVLEGSTLGGLVLARAVEATLGPTGPTSYLRLRGADTPRAWKSFIERLGAFGATATAGQMNAACDIACATFDAYAVSFVATGAIEDCLECTR